MAHHPSFSAAAAGGAAWTGAGAASSETPTEFSTTTTTTSTTRTTPGAGADCIALKRAPVPELTARWTKDRAPRVSSEQLPGAIDALLLHHRQRGFFDLSARDARIHETHEVDGTLEIAHVPNRLAALAAQRCSQDGFCVLCTPPEPEQRGLSWRSYTVWPNVFPYVPIENQHVVIAASKCTPQHVDRRIAADMIDLQAALGEPGATLLYNGMAGNSEDHLHWHALRRRTPIEALLDEGTVKREVLRSERGGTIAAFDADFSAGFVIEGDRAYVARWCAELAQRIEADTARAGACNVALLRPRAGVVRALVIPRKKTPRPGDEARPNLGAIDLLGLQVCGRAQLPADFASLRRKIARQHLVSPSELAWTEGLRGLPAGDLASAMIMRDTRG